MKQQDEDEYCNKEALLIPRDKHQKIKYNQNWRLKIFLKNMVPWRCHWTTAITIIFIYATEVLFCSLQLKAQDHWTWNTMRFKSKGWERKSRARLIDLKS